DVCKCGVANTTIVTIIVHGSSVETRPVAAEGDVGQRGTTFTASPAVIVHGSTAVICLVAREGNICKCRVANTIKAIIVHGSAILPCPIVGEGDIDQHGTTFTAS